MKKRVLSFAMLSPLALFAHEGHGHTEGFTIIHYLLEPLHMIVTGIIVFALVMLFRSLRRKEKKA